jgi:hypothetical protein
MQMNLITRPIVTWLLAMLLSVALPAEGSSQKPQKTPQKPQQQSAIDLQRPVRPVIKPPSGPSFYISPVESAVPLFSILLGDGAGNTVAGTFTLQQLDVFEAVLEEAKAFALTDEKVGSAAPITTRLMEQHEWSLFVDVSKIGDKSRFYISMVTPQGKLTAPAGEITRGSKKEHSAMLIDALSRIKDAKVGAQPSR